MVDSFIILTTQQPELQSNAKTVKLPLLELSDTDFSLKVPWTQFIPTNIRIAPFPTREYTDDQFQAIVKEVMGIL
jgi:ATP-binding cassette subfamily A (ABC1) protein 3